MRTPEPISLKDLQRQGVKRLRDGGVESAALDARLLLCHVAGISHETLVVRGDEPATDKARSEYLTLIERRAAGEPVARMVGEKEFWGLTFKIGPDTLVPRPDSECIVEAALEVVPDKAAPLRILDLGTGTGCLLLALLSELPNARGVGIDISGGALDVARANAASLELGARAMFARGNWTEGIEGPFDIIISNPPYIPAGDIDALMTDVREHDPLRALDGGADGLDCYRIILKQAPALLAEGGHVVLETAPDLYAELSEMVRAAPHWRTLELINDLASRARGMRFAKNDLAL